MQPDMAVDASVVGIEVVPAPLVAGSHAGGAIGVLWIGHAEGAFLVGGGVVHFDRKHVLLCVEMRGNIRTFDRVFPNVTGNMPSESSIGALFVQTGVRQNPV